MSELYCRNVVELDLGVCALMLREVYAAPPYNEHWEVSDAQAYLSRFFSFDPPLCFVAERRGDIVGALFAYSYPWHGKVSCYIREMFVRPSAQGRGVYLNLQSLTTGEKVRRRIVFCNPLGYIRGDID